MGNLIVIILELAIQVIQLYTFVVLASVIFSWLVAFGVVNPNNPTVRSVFHALAMLTEPALRRIRRWMPDLGGIDITPIFLLLACWFAIRVIAEVIIPQVRALGL